MRSFLNIGVHPDLPEGTARRVRLANGVVAATVAFAAVLAAAAAAGPTRPGTALVAAGALALGALVLVLHHGRRYAAARLALLLGLAAILAAWALSAPSPSPVRYGLLVVACSSLLLPQGTGERPWVFAVAMALFAAAEGRHDASAASLGAVALTAGALYLLGRLYVGEGDRAVDLVVQQKAELREQYEQLHALNAALHESVQTAQAQALRLDALNTVKDRIVSVISHDLRGPLSSLDALLEAHEEGAFSPEEVAQLVRDTRRTLQTTREQIDDVLTWARILLGRSDVSAVTWMNEAVRRAAKQAALRADLKGIRLETAVPHDCGVPAEPGSVMLLLRNLIGNALKFTPPGGTVCVESLVTEDGCVLRVRDTGVGMSAERVARLNAGTSTGTTLGTHGEKGSGLGLVLCREVAQHFGGTLRLESAEGEGTVATVAFPPSARTEPEPGGDAPRAYWQPQD